MFDRFDVCEAYWLFYCHWHRGGMTLRCEAKGRGIAEQLDRMRYRPSPLLELDTMSDGAREIYELLVAEYHHTCCPYGDAA